MDRVCAHDAYVLRSLYTQHVWTVYVHMMLTIYVGYKHMYVHMMLTFYVADTHSIHELYTHTMLTIYVAYTYITYGPCMCT